MFTLSRNGDGKAAKPPAAKRSTMSRATRAASSTWAQPLLTCENAMAGTPNRYASVAAATVPEYSVSSPMFWPLLMPETTRSGSASDIPVSAMCTQSVGVPLVK